MGMYNQLALGDAAWACTTNWPVVNSKKEMQLTQHAEIFLEPSAEANHTERRRPRMDPGGIKPLVSHDSQAHHHAFSALCSCSISISVVKSHLQQSEDEFSAESLQPPDHPRAGHDSTQVWAHSLTLYTHRMLAQLTTLTPFGSTYKSKRIG